MPPRTGGQPYTTNLYEHAAHAIEYLKRMPSFSGLINHSSVSLRAEPFQKSSNQGTRMVFCRRIHPIRDNYFSARNHTGQRRPFDADLLSRFFLRYLRRFGDHFYCQPARPLLDR